MCIRDRCQTAAEDIRAAQIQVYRVGGAVEDFRPCGAVSYTHLDVYKRQGMDPPQFLHPGDTVQCEIEGIGTLTNTVR